MVLGSAGELQPLVNEFVTNRRHLLANGGLHHDAAHALVAVPLAGRKLT